MYTMLDFIEAAPSLELPDRALLEVRKLPARLGLDEVEDLVDYAADLKTFQEVIAPAGAALFANARTPTRARKEANSRLRTALKRFLAQMTPTVDNPNHSAEWEVLRAWVASQEGFTDRGAMFTTGAHRAVACLRARFGHTAPAALTGEEVTRVLATVPAEKRKSVRRAVKFLTRLQAGREHLPAEIAGLLPSERLVLPIRETRHWPDLPAALRQEAEAMFDAILAAPTLLVDEALARLTAGETAEDVIAEINAARTRETRNPALWRKQYRGVIAWLYRAAYRDGILPADTLETLFTQAVVHAALRHHLADAEAGALRPSDETQTLKSRLDGVKTLAKYGRNDPALVAAIDVLRLKHKVQVRNRHVKGLARRSEALVTELHRGGTPLARRIVEAPQLIHAAAVAEFATWETQTATQRCATLKLCAAAAIWALQMSRPRRRVNLICERLRAARDPVTRKKTQPRTLWADGADFTVQTPALEVKNAVDLEFAVTGPDASVLRWWIDVIRPMLLEERRLDPADIYLFPGSSVPADLPTGLTLPAGTVSHAWFAEAWRRGADVVGLDVTSHQARHMLVVTWLQVRPGDYTGAAALLGDTEDTVRRKYGRDDGAAVARSIRAETRAHFKTPKRRT